MSGKLKSTKTFFASHKIRLMNFSLTNAVQSICSREQTGGGGQSPPTQKLEFRWPEISIFFFMRMCLAHCKHFFLLFTSTRLILKSCRLHWYFTNLKTIFFDQCNSNWSSKRAIFGSKVWNSLRGFAPKILGYDTQTALIWKAHNFIRPCPSIEKKSTDKSKFLIAANFQRL